MTEKITVLSPNGSSSEVDYPSNLKGFQTLVGGYIELVYAKKKVFVVNEEGIPMGLEHNPKASEMAKQHLVGTVLLLEGPALARFKAEE